MQTDDGLSRLDRRVMEFERALLQDQGRSSTLAIATLARDVGLLLVEEWRAGRPDLLPPVEEVKRRG